MLIIAFHYVDNQDEFGENPFYDIEPNANIINAAYIKHLFATEWVIIGYSQRLSESGFQEALEARESARGEKLTTIVSALRDHVIGDLLRKYFGHNKFLHVAIESTEKEEVFVNIPGFLAANITRLSQNLFDKIGKHTIGVFELDWHRMDGPYGGARVEEFCRSQVLKRLYDNGVIGEETLIIVAARKGEDDHRRFLGPREVQMEEFELNASDHPVYSLLDKDFEDKYLNAKSKEDELKKSNHELIFRVFRITNATLQHWENETTFAVDDYKKPKKKKTEKQIDPEELRAAFNMAMGSDDEEEEECAFCTHAKLKCHPSKSELNGLIGKMEDPNLVTNVYEEGQQLFPALDIFPQNRYTVVTTLLTNVMIERLFHPMEQKEGKPTGRACQNKELDMWNGVIDEFNNQKRQLMDERSEGRFDMPLPKWFRKQSGLEEELNKIVQAIRKTIKPMRNSDLRTCNVIKVSANSPDQAWHVDDGKISEPNEEGYITILVAISRLDAINGGTEFRCMNNKVFQTNLGDGLIFSGSIEHRGTANESTRDRYFLYAVVSVNEDEN